MISIASEIIKQTENFQEIYEDFSCGMTSEEDLFFECSDQPVGLLSETAFLLDLESFVNNNSTTERMWNSATNLYQSNTEEATHSLDSSHIIEEVDSPAPRTKTRRSRWAAKQDTQLFKEYKSMLSNQSLLSERNFNKAKKFLSGEEYSFLKDLSKKCNWKQSIRMLAQRLVKIYNSAKVTARELRVLKRYLTKLYKNEITIDTILCALPGKTIESIKKYICWKKVGILNNKKTACDIINHQ